MGGWVIIVFRYVTKLCYILLNFGCIILWQMADFTLFMPTLYCIVVFWGVLNKNLITKKNEKALLHIRGAGNHEVYVSSQTFCHLSSSDSFSLAHENSISAGNFVRPDQWHCFSHFLSSPHDWTIQQIHQICYLHQQHLRNTTSCSKEKWLTSRDSSTFESKNGNNYFLCSGTAMLWTQE